MKIYCEKSDGTPLTIPDFTSCLNPIPHSAIETFAINIGECEIYRINRLYPLLAKLYFLNNLSDKARTSFKSFFEGYEPDINDEVQTDITECFDTLDSGGYKAKDPQGKIAESLINKKEHFFVFQLISPFLSFGSLILPDIDVGEPYTFYYTFWPLKSS